MDENINTIDLEKEEHKKNLAHYRQTLGYMSANVPIESLCLPTVIENILIKEGFIRVYDLMAHDFREVKGIGRDRFDIIAASLDEFVSIGF